MTKTNKEIQNNYYTEDNLVENNYSPREIISPSGRYKLLIRNYSTKKGCWNYSRGTVYRISDNHEVCDIKRNYSSFSHSFVTKNNEEYLITGRSYMSQTIINLESGEIFEPEGDHYDGYAFCWAGATLSSDGNTLLVEGCHWAASYEYRFFDFTNPGQGWPELEIYENGKHTYLDMDNRKQPEFNQDGTITCYKTSELYLPLNKFDNDITEKELSDISDGEFDNKENWTDVIDIKITLQRQNNKMVITDRWVSSLEQERIEKRRIANSKYKKWLKEFRKTDPLYLKMIELIEFYNFQADEYDSVGITHKNWCPDFDKEERRWCRRIVKESGSYTVDLEWAVETGPIKLIVYKDGKHLEDKFFQHSATEMENTFKHTNQLLNLENI